MNAYEYNMVREEEWHWELTYLQEIQMIDCSGTEGELKKKELKLSLYLLFLNL